MNLCVFCLKHSSDTSSWCKENPGEGCTYGMHHEFPDSQFAPAKQQKKQQPVKKADKQVCIKCNLHARNPASASNGCQHEYNST